MAMKVLQDKSEISKARDVLDREGISHVDPRDSRLKRKLRKLGLIRGVVMGDNIKSWDVLATVNFVGSKLKPSDPVLDIGCYCSEILASLHKKGFSNLAGVDLNPELNKMPYQDSIRYEVSNFMSTKYKDESFKAITAISVIEHGFNSQELLREVSRLLMSGGFFVASFDYWPDKIDTSETKIFGMDWKIFSKEEVDQFISEAADYGLYPAGQLEYSAKDKPIECAGKSYTFGWLALIKSS